MCDDWINNGSLFDMEGLILLRYHKDLSQKTINRWELVEILIDTNRDLRRLCYAFKKINDEYMDSLNAYVEYEPNKLVRAFNLFFLDRQYERSCSRIVKKFSKVAEMVTFS